MVIYNDNKLFAVMTAKYEQRFHKLAPIGRDRNF